MKEKYLADQYFRDVWGWVSRGFASDVQRIDRVENQDCWIVDVLYKGVYRVCYNGGELAVEKINCDNEGVGVPCCFVNYSIPFRRQSSDEVHQYSGYLHPATVASRLCMYFRGEKINWDDKQDDLPLSVEALLNS